MDSEDVGALHNRMLGRMNDRMLSTTSPLSDSVGFARAMAEEMRLLCHDAHDACHGALVESILASDRRSVAHRAAGDAWDVASVWPDDDEDDKDRRHARTRFTAMYDVLVEATGADDVYDGVRAIVAETERSDAHHGVKAAVRAVASVATSSTQYWTDARRDTTNAFYQLHAARYNHHGHHRRRRTQIDLANIPIIGPFFGAVVDDADFPFDPSALIIADFIGAVVGSVDPIIDLVLGTNNSTIAVMWSVLSTSTSDSLKAGGVEYWPGLSGIVRCVLEDVLQNSGCDVFDLLLNTTNTTDGIPDEDDDEEEEEDEEN